MHILFSYGHWWRKIYSPFFNSNIIFIVSEKTGQDNFTLKLKKESYYKGISDHLGDGGGHVHEFISKKL